MHFRTFFLIICALLWAFPASAVGGVDPAVASTVLITGILPGGSLYAAGVIVRDNRSLLILTARHVAEVPNLTVLTSSGEWLKVRTVQFIPGRDLALLQTEAASSQYPTPAFAHASDAQRNVYLWGFPKSAEPTRAAGSILSLTPVIPDGESNGRFTLMCGACDHGDSGAGIFTDDGRLIGILTAGWKNKQGVVRMIVAEPVVQLTTVIAAALTTVSR